MLRVDGESEQLCLFEGMGGIDLRRLRIERENLAVGVRAANTVKATAADWKGFVWWCGQAGRCELPASPETVELYITHELQRGLKVSSVTRRVCSVSFWHKSKGLPTPVTAAAYGLLTAARRLRKEQPAAKAAITPDELRRISRALGSDPRSVRDRAIMVVGSASGMRRSELGALNAVDVEFGQQGFSVHIRSGKRDQEGKGRKIGIFPGKRAASCPLRCLKAWLRVRGKWDGPLFCRLQNGTHIVTRERLYGQAVNNVVKRCAALIGLDPCSYGGHSLRSGMVTAALDTGVSELAIMRRSGHKSVATLQRYDRPKPFSGLDVMAKAL